MKVFVSAKDQSMIEIQSMNTYKSSPKDTQQKNKKDTQQKKRTTLFK